MFSTIRQSMAWLHTWIGLTLGAVLFAIFFAGSLCVFDKEIDRWMEPATRLPAPADFSLDALRPAIKAEVGKSPLWGVIPPSERNPVLQVRFLGPKGSAPIFTMNPSTGQILPDSNTLGASGFFLPFHYHLMIGWKQLGYWIVGFAACAMLLSVVSGLFIHARLIANVFTYRPDGHVRRRMLDLHNLFGVSALPFYILILLSGLWVSYSNLMPAGIEVAYGGKRAAFFSDVFGNYRRSPTREPGALAPLDLMMAEAGRRWGGGEPALVQIYNDGDQAAYVEMRRRNDDRITADPNLIYFDGATGQVLKYAPLRSAISVQRWLTGLHMIQFNRWAVRWLYFALGLMGCATVALGMMVWLEGQKARNGGQSKSGTRRFESFAIGAITGPVIGAVAYLVANQLLPVTTPNRPVWEQLAFYGTWALAVAHAFVRRGPGRGMLVWRDHVAVIAILALAAPMLNWATTGSNPLAGLHGVVWVDRTLLVATALALWGTTVLTRRARVRAT